ncbi:24915_t:CDS:2, partial [Racocetra persica]
SFKQITENNTLSWPKLFNRNFIEVESELNNVLGPSVDNLEELRYYPNLNSVDIEAFIQQVCSNEAIYDKNLSTITTFLQIAILSH